MPSPPQLSFVPRIKDDEKNPNEYLRPSELGKFVYEYLLLHRIGLQRVFFLELLRKLSEMLFSLRSMAMLVGMSVGLGRRHVVDFELCIYVFLVPFAPDSLD